MGLGEKCLQQEIKDVRSSCEYSKNPWDQMSILKPRILQEPSHVSRHIASPLCNGPITSVDRMSRRDRMPSA